MSDIEPDNVVTPIGPTRLIRDSGIKQVLTANQETDVRTALTRGVREYLEQVYIDMPGGRQLKFKRVLQTWASPEMTSEYPSACVYAMDPGTYSMSSFTPIDHPLPDGKSLLRWPCEFVQQILVDVWTQDNVERMGIEMMIENAFNPVGFMYGFRLELPHYFNVRAAYEPQQMAYVDDADAAQRRWRRITHLVTARCPLSIYVGPTPQFQPRADFKEITDTPNDNPLSIAYDPRRDPQYGSVDGPQLRFKRF